MMYAKENNCDINVPKRDMQWQMDSIVRKKYMERRDKFIAKQVNDTLREEECGILFMGAFHNVRKWLEKDIHVEELKDINKVREYQKLLPFYRSNKERIERLSKYLTDPCCGHPPGYCQ